MFKSEENKYLMSLLEAPQEGEPILGLRDELRQGMTSLKGSNPLGKYGMFNLFKVSEGVYTSIWLIHPDNDYPSLYYKFKVTEPGEYIITDKIFGDENYKGLFSHFFTNFVLKMTKTVESDRILTQMGFNFWVRLVKNSKNWFYILDLVNGELLNLTDETDLKDYYGAAKSFANYKYIISTIPRAYDEIIRLRN